MKLLLSVDDKVGCKLGRIIKRDCKKHVQG